MAGSADNGRADLSECILQARAMVCAQLGCSVEDALDRMRLWARATGWSVEEIAAGVIERVIRIDS
ncbi:MAG: hypothetical protein QOF59_1237 [Actinomycetota bacterium]|jgi:hypothetical protein|nr:hypothetical protein [Actinomycetota bacterium]MDQ1475314.1 hypothetical protein [Actinomycetota bacterium]